MRLPRTDVRVWLLFNLAVAGFAAAIGACSSDANTSPSDGGGGSGASGASGGGTSTGGGTTTTNTGGGTTTTNTGGGGAGPCGLGTIVCDGTTKKVCDGNGGFTDVVDCAPNLCTPGIGCTICVPGSGTCNGNVSTVCNADGQGTTDYECDPAQGVTCDPQTGQCLGECAPLTLGQSYFGCDYYPTVTEQEVSSSFNFAVAVANTTANVVNVTITQGAASITTATVAANDVAIINLPWVDALKGTPDVDPAASVLVASGAYRLRTDQPVTVYQYSPIEYTQGGFNNSYTNDASLLLPVNAWTGQYRVASRNPWQFISGVWYPGFYAVTASQDATTVTLTPSATGNLVKAGAGVNADGTGTVQLNRGDVLQVFTNHTGAGPCSGGYCTDPADLTGTLVSADKPVQVIGGHKCTFIPFDIGYCDHNEESMIPVEALSNEYIVTAPLIPTGGAVPKAEMVRVIATAPNTTVTYDPPQAGAPTSLVNAGDYFEISMNAADFLISADQKILVSQYMLGQDAGGGSGDPAMSVAVATKQYRKSYLFHAPTNYDQNFVNITAPDGVTVTLDGVAVAGFTTIGNTGYSIARVALDNSGTGNHLIEAASGFGISVYGYGQYTSYWYPGGLDLYHI